MGKTSSAVKRRYNAKTYDNIQIMLPKGNKDIIKARAAELNKSMTKYIHDLIKADMDKKE